MEIYLIIVFSLIFIAIIISFVDNSVLKVREYSLKSSKVNNNTKIVFLSDMHGLEHGKENKRLINRINDIAPDYILIGGDMINGKVNADFSHVVKMFEKLKSYKMVYGIGNHEYRVKIYTDMYGSRYDEYVKKLRNNDVIVTENENIRLNDDIDVQGLMLDKIYYKRNEKVNLSAEALRKYIGERNANRYRILLAHNPEYFDAYCNEADLVLSGHMHGGIMRLPFINGVISTRLKIFPKFAGGRYDKNESTMIVSRGLGSHTIPLRIFNPTELVVININEK